MAADPLVGLAPRQLVAFERLSSAAPGHSYDAGLADLAVRPGRLIADPGFWHLFVAILRFLIALGWESVSVSQEKGQAEKLRARARRLRDLLVELGPTFVKVGQFLSMRKDLLPPEVVNELAQLQDNVPPFSLNFVRKTIVADLGRPPEELFSIFDSVPIASASLGQVHRACLGDGSWVVVKVQRPDLPQRLYRDLGYMRIFARAWRFLVRQQRDRAWLDLTDEFGRTLFTELDYIQEGRNADRLRKLMRYRTRIRVPRVCWRYTGRRVLTLEYLPATKIDDTEELKRRGLDLRDLGNLLVECYLEQVLLSGFFHADPHAGNLAVDESGHLVIYDFGVMGEISTAQQAAFAGLAQAALQMDRAKIVGNLQELGLISPGAPSELLVRSLSCLLDFCRGAEIAAADLRRLEKDIERLIAERAFNLPPGLSCVLRVGSGIDALARTLKPNFSFAQAGRRILRRWKSEQAAASMQLMANYVAFH